MRRNNNRLLWTHLRTCKDHHFPATSSPSLPPPPPARLPTTTGRRYSSSRHHRHHSSNKKKLPAVKPKTKDPPSSALFQRITEIVAPGEENPPLGEAEGRGIFVPRGEGKVPSFGRDDESSQYVRRFDDTASVSQTKEEVAGAIATTRVVEISELEDVSPTVHRITEIVRSSHVGGISMEERLESSGLNMFDPEVVEKVLKRCFKARHLAFRFFNWVKLRPGFHHTTATYNAMIYIAGEAEEFNLVEKLVDEMGRELCPKNIKTWTILICHYGKAKQIGKVLCAFEEMRKSNCCEPDQEAYAATVHALCKAGKAEIAVEFYREMVGKNFGVDRKLYEQLMNCLARSGNITMVRSVGGDMMKTASKIEVYSLMLRSLCIARRIVEAQELSNEIRKKNLMADSQNVETIVKGLCRIGRVSEAMKVVDDMKGNLLPDGKVYGLMIDGYLRGGDVSSALRLLHQMKELVCLPTISTYTQLIQHLFRSGEHEKACELYDEMLGNGVEPDTVTITAMVAGHVRSGRISEAWDAFESMKKKGIQPTCKAYSVFIKELCKVSKANEAFKLLLDMTESSINAKDKIYLLVMSSLRGDGEVDKVRRVEQMNKSFKLERGEADLAEPGCSVHEEPKSLECSPVLDVNSTKMPNRYNDNDLDIVCRILSSSNYWQSIQEELEKSGVHYTPKLVEEILRSCQKHGSAALQFFSWVGNLPGYTHTTETYSMAIKISGSAKDFKHMRSLFYEMRRRRCTMTPNTWTIMIAQYGQAGLTEMALKKFEEMKSAGFQPNGSTYKFLIVFLCGKKGRKLFEAIKVFNEMIHARYMPDKELAEIYLSCLCESGRLSDARKCVESLSKHGFAVQISHSLFVKSLCRSGLIEEALESADEMDKLGCTVDQYVYGSLIHGLLRVGRLEEALSKAEAMKKAGIPQSVHVYTSLIVHFFKEKQIEKAVEIVKKMLEDGCEPTVVTYSALIRGYMSSGMVSDAWEIFRRMTVKGPLPDFKTYSMFMACLCRVGRSEEGLQLIQDMLGRGIFPSAVNFRTVFYGLNREGKQDLARDVLQRKWLLARKRKLSA